MCFIDLNKDEKGLRINKEGNEKHVANLLEELLEMRIKNDDDDLMTPLHTCTRSEQGERRKDLGRRHARKYD